MSYFATFLVPEPENVRIDYELVRFMHDAPCSVRVTVSWKASEHETHIALRRTSGERDRIIVYGNKAEFFSDDDPSVFDPSFEGFSIFHKAGHTLL